MTETAKLALGKLKSGMDRHPLRTKVIGFGILNVAGELFSQKKAKKLQIRRLVLAMLYGFVYNGPVDHLFRTFIARISKGKKDWATFFKKVFCENILYYPWNNFVYMVYLGLVIEGKPWRSVLTDVKKEYPPSQLKQWKLVTKIFAFQGRVMFYAVLGSYWAIYTKVRARTSAPKIV